jgi:N-acetylneuraminic acid mutarotase
VCGGVSSRKTVEFLEPNSDNWKYGPELNTGRDSHQGLPFKGTLLVLGGKNKRRILSDIEILGSPYYSWAVYDNLSLPVFGFSAVFYKKNIIIIGGFKDISANSFYSTVLSYQVYSKKKKKLKSLPYGLANSGSILWENKIYIFGGRNYNGLQNKVLRMDIVNENSGNS